MQGVSKPEKPVGFGFHNIPGKNFREKIQFTKYFVYFLCTFFIIVGIFLMFAVPVSWAVFAALLLCFVVGPLMVCFVTYYSNNYIFEEVAPGQYQAVLKAEGFAKLNDYQKKALINQVFEEEKEKQNQTEQEQSAKKSKAHVYAAIISLVVIACLMYWAPITRKLVCTHVRGIVYNCDLQQRAVLRNLDTVKLGAITGAVVARKYDKDEHKTSYQIQFRSPNNTNISYTQMWLLDLPFMLDRKVDALNKKFSKEEDFSYYSVNYVVVLGIIVLLFYPLIVAIMVRKGEKENSDNNYFSPERYKAILKAEGLEDIEDRYAKPWVVTDEKIINYLKDDETTAMQKEFYDNSWSAKDQSERDQDVEDLTKQFYDDGK